MRAPGAAVKDWNDSKLYCGCVCACLGPCVLRSPHAALAVAKGAVPRSIHGPRLLLPWVLRLGVSMCLACPCFDRCASGYPHASFALALVGAPRGIHMPRLPILLSVRIVAVTGLSCLCFGRRASGYPRALFVLALVGAHRGIHGPRLPLLWSARIGVSTRLIYPCFGRRASRHPRASLPLACPSLGQRPFVPPVAPLPNCPIAPSPDCPVVPLPMGARSGAITGATRRCSQRPDPFGIIHHRAPLPPPQGCGRRPCSLWRRRVGHDG